MGLANVIAAVLLISLNLYVLLGGADFGGGIWYLLTWGRRKEALRKVIREAIAPVWEANHVWLILIIVLLFTAFPPAFSLITTRLHIPLTLMCLGIIARGSAFTFRHYDPEGRSTRLWERLFATSSLTTPIFLGACLGAITTGALREDAYSFPAVFVKPWLAWCPLVVGIFTVSLFAFVAAVYLTNEESEPEVREDFRKMALVSAIFTGLCALASMIALKFEAYEFHRNFVESNWFWPLQAVTALFAGGTFVALYVRRFPLARIFAILQVSMIVGGWGMAQYPYLVAPVFTIAQAAAPPRTLQLLTIALAAGTIVLAPSLYFLFAIFKRPSERGPDLFKR